MNYYHKTWTSNTTLESGKTLEEEFEKFDEFMAEPDGSKPLTVNERIEKGKLPKLKKELYGHVRIEDMPFDLHEQFIRSKLNIPIETWDKYDFETKGMLLALDSIQGKMDTIERVVDMTNRKKKDAGNS